MLVLLAVFCFSSLQASEGLHQHSLGDAADLCLVCKADSGTAVADSYAGAEKVLALEVTATFVVQAGTRFVRLTPPLRGPPHIS